MVEPAEHADMTPEQVAGLLGTTASTVRRWVASGFLRARRLPGPRPRYRIARVDALEKLHATAEMGMGGLAAGSADSNGPRAHGRGEQQTAPRLGHTFTGRDFADLLERVASPDPAFAVDLQRIRAEWRSAPRRPAAW